MTKIDIFSGFLGAGKTTLIKKLLAEAYAGQKVVLIENEFGQIGIDSGFLRDSGVQITEMNQGCICCSLVGDFGRALRQVLTDFAPDRILIEPSGVGKLSDVMRAVREVTDEDERVVLNSATTVVDAGKCKLYMRNFGEFFNDQVESAGCIVLSHTDRTPEDKLAAAVALLREHNATATIVTTVWDALDGSRLLDAMEQRNTLRDALAALEHEHEHEHHHHHHDGECEDPNCHCHDHEHEHGHEHHHHHADEVFSSWGVETARKYTAAELTSALEALDDTAYGTILRAKGIVAGADGTWLHFDYVPGEPDVRVGSADIIGRLCVIGAGLDKAAIAALFRVAEQ